MRAGIEGQKMEMSAMESIMGPLPQGIGGAGQGGGGNSPIPNSGGMGAGGMPGMMGMPGMPSQDEMMQVTMQYMQQNGIQDISQVDFGAVMQFMQGGGVGVVRLWVFALISLLCMLVRCVVLVPNVRIVETNFT